MINSSQKKIEKEFDVIVIGGGPSGMMAAGRASERGLRVLLLEKNRDVGKKLSLTGGGRCNILNFEKDTRKLLENFGEAKDFLFSPFAKFGMQEAFDFFESRGLPIVVQARNRAFPASEKSTDVINCLKKYTTDNKVELRTNVKVTGLEIEKGKIKGVKTDQGIFVAKNYVLATGGASYKETGSTGEGFKWLQKIGHLVHESNPNIVPLIVSDDWVKVLSGNTLSFMKITFGSNLTKVQGKFSKTGKILFTHFGLSGPLILNSAHEVKKLLKKGDVKATIDMYPDTELGTIREKVLKIFDKNKNKQLSNVMPLICPNGLEKAFDFLLPPNLLKAKVHSISKEERNNLADLLKAMPLTITGTMGLDWAVVSDGGVDLHEVDMKTMKSKLVDNLYFTGDILHINRPSGGFSLQLCWTTGFVAGDSV